MRFALSCTHQSVRQRKLQQSVTDDDHEWVIKGIVPGVFTNILNLYTEANHDFLSVAKMHQQFERAFHESAFVPEIGDYPYAMSEAIDSGWVDGVQPCWTGTSFYKDKAGNFVEWKKDLYNVEHLGKVRLRSNLSCLDHL